MESYGTIPSMHTALGKCKAAVFAHTNQLIATPYFCTRKAVRDGFCTQHHKIAYRDRLVPPSATPPAPDEGAMS